MRPWRPMKTPTSEWELINDDGFVYKRKKRPRPEPAAADPPPDPAAERKHRRERKKRALLKLRERYLKEISRWELLSSTLKEMEQTAQAQLLERQELYPTTSFDGASSSEEPSALDSRRWRLVDDLLSQKNNIKTSCIPRGKIKETACRPSNLGPVATRAHGCIK